MVQLTKIYTKGGDKGKTSLGSGTRVEKNNPRVEALGDVDELNAFMGTIKCEDSAFNKMITAIQHDLFDLGGDLCFPEADKPDYALSITKSYVHRLEKWIDQVNSTLEPLKSFVLPGGTLASQHIHLARTIARRAERRVFTLSQAEPINLLTLQYLNRLSDLLFVLARAENDKGVKDILWEPGLSQKVNSSNSA